MRSLLCGASNLGKSWNICNKCAIHVPYMFNKKQIWTCSSRAEWVLTLSCSNKDFALMVAFVSGQWHLHTYALCGHWYIPIPSQMFSSLAQRTMDLFDHRTCSRCLSVHFSDNSAAFLYEISVWHDKWQWFSKALLSQCGYIHHGTMMVSEGLKVTHSQHRFMDWLRADCDHGTVGRAVGSSLLTPEDKTLNCFVAQWKLSNNKNKWLFVVVQWEMRH